MQGSNKSLIRIITEPYIVLFILFSLTTGAGSTWLYFKAREAQSQFLVQGLLSTVSPMVKELSRSDITPLIKNEGSWLHKRLDTIFAQIPGLMQFQIRTTKEGFSKKPDAHNKLLTTKLPGMDATQGNSTALHSSTAAHRLYSESASLLRIEFRFEDKKIGPVSLELAFNRETLQGSVAQAMSIITNAITLFNVAGICALFIAFAVTLWAARRARLLESEIQKLYHYATAAELMAGLVHDLRNPLASFRANIASLKITPDETDTILQEMDEDLIRLDAKLGSMMDLTKKRDEPFSICDVHELLEKVSRQANPILKENKLILQLHCLVEHPVELMKSSLSDALLNLVLNAAESGQKNGIIELTAREENGNLVFEIADRGTGLPENQNIFKPFVSTKATGHGLGLAISRRTAESHGGTLTAVNRAGGGAVFTLTILQKTALGKTS